MTVNELLERLEQLQSWGYGNTEIYYRHSSSGDCGTVNGAHITNTVDECGPFELDEGEDYVSLSVGY